MKIVVIGGTGRIGSRVVAGLQALGHEALAAAPNTGVDTLTGKGLAEALAGAQVVVDVANSPSFDDEPAMTFFQTSGRNLIAAEIAAGVRHHLALSVVGTERLQTSGYFRAKLAQEALIEASPIPYTLLRSTQFFPFITGIIQSGAVGDEVRLSQALVQPVSADDVAEALVDLALASPLNRTVEIAGPQPIRLDAFARRYLDAVGDHRRVVADPQTLYFGAVLDDTTLVPGPSPRLGKSTLDAWLQETALAAAAKVA
ncbi:MAG: NmrA family transcriptional regulator [Caulobacterales bacterium 68-7]|nr:MAG: NmrA family transcriptional regulator [Caulobacterales bacterium 68-7]